MMNNSLGCIISMYDEIETVSNTIDFLKKENCPIIVIQSNPHQDNKILDKSKVDYYTLLPDLAGSKESYAEERRHDELGTTTPAKALTRNYSYGFKESKNFDTEWWIAILGDTLIYNLNGITKIIQKMIKNDKKIAFTRAVGQVFLSVERKLDRIQKHDTTDFMPQFFIVHSDLVKTGLFNEVKITNIFTPEQCFGDEILRYCKENSLEFWGICYSFCDYPFPKFVDGLKYNPKQAKVPRYLDGTLNAYRRFKVRLTK